MLSKNKNLIIHDNFEINGGAEKIIVELSKNLKIKIFSLYINKFIKLNLFYKFIFFNKINYNPKFRFLLNFIFYYFYPFNFKNYNNIIFSGHYSLLLLREKIPNKIIYFCHSPPRFLYDNFSLYKKKYKFIFNFILTRKIIFFYKNLYKKKLSLCDIIICNSITSKKRILKIVKNKKIKIIYPGIDFSRYKYSKSKNYYLSLSRLHWSKRINELLDVFSSKKMKKIKLIMASFGPLEHNVRNKIKNKKLDNITFEGKISDKRKIQLLSNCKSVIHIPIREEFGLVNLETIASKKFLITTDGGDSSQLLNNFENVKIIRKYNNNKLIRAINEIENYKNLKKFKIKKNFIKKFSIDTMSKKLKQIMYNI